jgi:VanZ family protein
VVRWLVWLIFVIAWSLALELPVEPPERTPGREVIIEYKVFIAKSLHVGVYAFFTALTVWLPVPLRYRWILMFVLMLHAWGSEMLQEAFEPFCHRTGQLSDVGFDAIGIVVGAALTWRWWTAEDSKGTAQLPKSEHTDTRIQL